MNSWRRNWFCFSAFYFIHCINLITLHRCNLFSFHIGICTMQLTPPWCQCHWPSIVLLLQHMPPEGTPAIGPSHSWCICWWVCHDVGEPSELKCSQEQAEALLFWVGCRRRIIHPSCRWCCILGEHVNIGRGLSSRWSCNSGQARCGRPLCVAHVFARCLLLNLKTQRIKDGGIQYRRLYCFDAREGVQVQSWELPPVFDVSGFCIGPTKAAELWKWAFCILQSVY